MTTFYISVEDSLVHDHPTVGGTFLAVTGPAPLRHRFNSLLRQFSLYQLGGQQAQAQGLSREIYHLVLAHAADNATRETCQQYLRASVAQS